jgi:hypothetical protein
VPWHRGRGSGRPKVDVALEHKAQKQLKKGVGILKVAKTLGLGTGTVQRIKQEIEPVLIADSAAAFPRRRRDMASTLQRCRSWRPLALTRWRSFCGIGMTAP